MCLRVIRFVYQLLPPPDISAPRTHLHVGVCVASFGWVFVPHGGHPAGLAALGKGANIQDAQHAATHAQLILQDEAVLRA